MQTSLSKASGASTPLQIERDLLAHIEDDLCVPARISGKRVLLRWNLLPRSLRTGGRRHA